MKRLVFLLGLCVCMVYGDEYSKQRAEFMSKNFESKLKELVKESGLKSESAKLLYQAAMVPALYESGLRGNDANGGWSIYTISLYYKGSNGRYYFWNQYERLAQRVSEVCGANIGSEANGINESYTPAQQKCIKSLATLELEMNKDIVKWNLEQMKNKEIEENNERKEGCDVDYTPRYQLADTLWSKLQKEGKLGAFKDFNKLGMEQFYKGLSYLLVVKDFKCYWNATFNRCDGLKSISDFFESRDEELKRNFSFVYDSVEVNQQKLQARLDAVPEDARQADECYKTYLSTKEYQEARAIVIQKNARAKELEHRMSRAKALEKFISNDVGFSQKSLEFNACLGLGDDENQNKEILFSGQYAEIFDRKYYNEEYGGSHSMKEDTSDELKKHTLYRQLAWCAVKEAYKSVTPKAYDDVEKSMRKRFSSNAYLEVALSIADKKWKAMAEKYPCVDYESAIANPWYKDEAKFQNLLKDIDKDINKDLKPIIDNFNKEYEQCQKKIFESGREKCKEKLREKTLKQLQAKLK